MAKRRGEERRGKVREMHSDEAAAHRLPSCTVFAVKKMFYIYPLKLYVAIVLTLLAIHIT